MRVVRDTIAATGVMAVGAWLWAPDRPLVALGVVGGGALVGLSIWAVAGVVTAATAGAGRGERGLVSRALVLVKFFTRHGILALAAYVMMVRLHLDPVGMIVGVTSVVIAAAVAAARQR